MAEWMSLAKPFLYSTGFFYFAVLISSVFSSALGIGSFVLIPLFAIHFGAKESIAVITAYYLVQNVSKLFFFYRHIDFAVVRRLSAYALPGAIMGSYVFVYIPAQYFQKILGIGILLFIALDSFKSRSPFGGSKFILPLFGFTYGVASGVLGSGNAVKGPLFTSMGINKERYIATYAMTSFLMNLPKLVIYQSGDIVSVSLWGKAWPLLMVSVMGTYLGKKCISLIPELHFTTLMNVIFIGSAVSLLL